MSSLAKLAAIMQRSALHVHGKLLPRELVHAVEHLGVTLGVLIGRFEIAESPKRSRRT